MAATRTLFVTRLYEASLADDPGFEAFNSELAGACEMLAREDGAGRAWCKARGYGGGPEVENVTINEYGDDGGSYPDDDNGWDGDGSDGN
jgi:hypothetical protein